MPNLQSIDSLTMKTVITHVVKSGKDGIFTVISTAYKNDGTLPQPRMYLVDAAFIKRHIYPESSAIHTTVVIVDGVVKESR